MYQGGHKKPVPKKNRREKKDRKYALGQAQLRSPARTLNKLLKTATDRTKAELILIKPLHVNTGKYTEIYISYTPRAGPEAN